MTNNNVGWTAQSSHGWVHTEGEPGQTFTEDQLPHPDVQRASGLDPDKYRAAHGLWVDEAVGERAPVVGSETGKHPRDIAGNIGDLESFRSYPDGVPDYAKEDKIAEEEKAEETPAEENSTEEKKVTPRPPTRTRSTK